VLRPERVRPLPLEALAGLLGEAGQATPGPAERSSGPAAPAVTGVTHDSRAVRPGDLYAALPGSRRHGAEFVAEVAAAGAAAVLTDPAGAAAAEAAGLPVLVTGEPRAALGPVSALVYGDPSASLCVVGVTGTAGKTTTTYLLEHALRAGGHTTGLLGTVETRVAGEAVASVRTTPEAPDLQALLAVMVERGVTAVAMEVSSHALALGRVDGTRFRVGGFTNLGLDHLDFHGGVEEYFAAKALLFDGRCAAEVVNVDDPAGRRLVGPRTVTVSAAGAPTAAWRAEDVSAEGTGQRFTVLTPDVRRLPGRVALPGAFNVANALLAVACAAAAGVEPEEAVAGVASCPGVPGRLERVDPPGAAGGSGVVGIVDYAHEPASVAAVLATLRPVTAGRLLCVLGCGGDRDPGKRPLMGEAAALGADVLVVTDDNPRSEDPAAIRSAAVAGALAVPPRRGAEVLEVADRAEAIAEAVRRARPGDTVAVLGKGHEAYQEVAGVVHSFDDRVVLCEALRAVYA